MSLETYDGLKDEIASWIARSDTPSASERIDTFIDLAEAHMNRNLLCLEMVKTETLSTTSSDDFVDLPEDFISLVSVSGVSDPKTIDFCAPASFNVKAYAGETGVPVAFTVSYNSTTGRYMLRFAPKPDGVYSYRVEYYAKVAALSSSTQTNWILTSYPEIYLNGCLYYAFLRYRSEIASDYKALFDNGLRLLNAASEGAFSGGSGMQISVVGSVV